MPVRTTTHRPRLLTLLRNQSTSQDSLGTPVDNWKAVGTAWTIDWKSLSGREIFGGGQIKAEADSQITLRYAASLAISVGDRLQYGSPARLFDINWIQNQNEQNQYWVLFVKEVPAGA